MKWGYFIAGLFNYSIAAILGYMYLTTGRGRPWLFIPLIVANIVATVLGFNEAFKNATPKDKKDG